MIYRFVLTVFSILLTLSLAISQIPLVSYEKDGLLSVEMESVRLSDGWIMGSETDSLGKSVDFIYWGGEQYFNETGHGILEIPIYINSAGTYRIDWRMKVGKGEDVTQHNDYWLKMDGAQIYAQNHKGHKVFPRPACQYVEGYDCPNGSSDDGFFKVYGQKSHFGWHAHTSDHNGHELYVDIETPGHYEIIINARSSYCYLDKILLHDISQISKDEAQALAIVASPKQPMRRTYLSIKENQFYINDKLTYEGKYHHHHKIEGLLFNARLVQGIFDDLNPETRSRFVYPDTKEWDPLRNTIEFVSAMKAWKEHGLLSFTLNLQGGSPMGYGNKNWLNSTFDKKGNLREDYMHRLEMILDEADRLGMVVLLGYFYFGQDHNLKNEKAVINAVDNITRWILDKGYRNLLIEINNECDIYYDHDILKADRVHELIARVQSMTKDGYRLYVGTSYSGGYVPKSNVVSVSDYLLLHGNSVEDPDRIAKMVKETKEVSGYKNQPILFNEDDHYDFDKPHNNLMSAVSQYASWGYFDFRREGENYNEGFQSVPVDWGINSERKMNFFQKIKELTGY